MRSLTPTIEEMREFWPRPTVCDGIDVSGLLTEIQHFAINTFDMLDVDKNNFLSACELEHALRQEQLNPRQKNYVRFLLINVEKIGRAYDDNDSAHPLGISRHDIAGISRDDLVHYFDHI